jgi:hypothetical protein
VSSRYTLPRAVAWLPGESIVGLLVRNAVAHGFPVPARMLRPVGCERDRLDALAVRHLDGGTALAFADLLGISAEAFDRMHHGAPEPRTARLLGHTVHEEMVSLARRRACPLCLRESPHHRAIWNASLVTVCPEHGVLLADRCPRLECGRPMRWTTASVTGCSHRACRGSLLDAPVTSVAPSSLGGLRNLVAMLFGEDVAGAPPLSPGDALRLSFLVGLAARGHRRVARPIGFAEDHPELVPAVLDAGWRVLSDFPRGFHAFLDGLRAGADGRKGRYGLRKQFGRFPDWLFRMSADPAFRLLVDEFADYTGAQPALATRSPVARSRRSEAFITATAASDILGLTYERLVEVADRNGLWLVEPTGKGAASLLHAGRFRAFAARLDDALSREGAAEALNLSRTAFRKVVRLLPVVPVGERALPERPFRRSDLQAFLARLEATAEPNAGFRSCDGLVTADTLARSKVTIADVLSAVLDGKLRPQAIDETERGIPRLLFRSEPARQAVSGPAPTMSVNDAAVALCVKQEVAYHWVRRGLLASVTGSGRQEAGRRVTADALAAFRAEYVTATEVAAAHGLRGRWVSVHLTQIGVAPASAPHIDGCRQFLFRRASVDAVDPSRLVSGVTKLVARGPDAVPGLWKKLLRALRAALGGGLEARFHTLRDGARGIVVQGLLARNAGVLGTYHFVLGGGAAAELSAAREAYVAFAFADRPEFLLVPWAEARDAFTSAGKAVSGDRGGWRLDIRARPDGTLEPFGTRWRRRL